MSDNSSYRGSGGLRSLVAALARPSQWGKALEELADALAVWRAGRRWGALWAGLPALVVLIVTTCVAVVLVCAPRHVRVRAYVERAESATRDGDTATALLCRRRVVQEDPAGLDHQFRLAQAYREVNDLRSYALLIANLAPDDRTGYGPAHFARARDLLEAPGSGKRERQAAVSHLTRALDVAPNNPDVLILLGRQEALEGRLETAERHLAAVLDRRPAVGLELARIYSQQGKPARARQTAEEAREFLRRASAERPDDVEIRLGLADASLFLEDFPAALATLDEGLRQGDVPAYRRAAARTYVYWSDAEKRRPEGRVERRVELLEQGILADPNEPSLFSRLVEVLQADAAGKENRLRSLLERMLAEGRSLPLAHLVLGTHYLTQGKHADARLHLEQAHRLDPRSATAANNLAWTLAHSDPPDLETALKLIDEVVRAEPNLVPCRDTRGRILAGLGRPQEALVDLEAALPAMPDSAGLHRALADVYTKLGRPTLAAEHQRAAERLTNATRP